MVFPVLNDALDVLAARTKGAVLSIQPAGDRRIELKYVFDGLEFMLESLPRPGLLTLAEHVELALPNCVHCDGLVGKCVLPCPTRDIDRGEKDLPLTTMILPSLGVVPGGTATVVISTDPDYYNRGRIASQDYPLCVITYAAFVQLYHHVRCVDGEAIGRFDIFRHDGVIATKMQDIALRPVVVPLKWRDEIAAVDRYLVRIAKLFRIDNNLSKFSHEKVLAVGC